MKNYKNKLNKQKYIYMKNMNILKEIFDILNIINHDNIFNNNILIDYFDILISYEKY